MNDLDIHEGDLVQIRPSAKSHAGEIGKVISVKAAEGKNFDDLSITVMHSDKESSTHYSLELILLRSTHPKNGRGETKYETR